MAQFQPRYDEAQKRAIACAIVDGSCSAPAAVALARHGELCDIDGERLAGFDMPVSTAQMLGRRERNARQGVGAGELSKADRPVAAKAIVNRTLDVLESELRVIERQKPGQERRQANRIATAERIAKAAETILKLERQWMTPSTPPPKKEEGKPRPSAEASELSREARKRKPEHPRPTSPPTNGDQGSVGPAAPALAVVNGDEAISTARSEESSEPTTT